MRPIADNKALSIYTTPVQGIYLLDQLGGIDDHTIADDTGDTGVEYPRRNQCSLNSPDGLMTVCRIVTAGNLTLPELSRQHIDYFPFTFIPPLGSNYSNNGIFHLLFPFF
jgi:hypothetical protein